MSTALTDEQYAMISAAETARSLIGMAYAGTGKTTTIAAMTHAIDRAARHRNEYLNGLYLAFNKAIVTDVGDRLAPSFTPRTIHSLAYRSVPRQITARCRRNGKITPWGLPSWLEISGATSVVTEDGATTSLTPLAIAACANRTVKRYCQSEDIDLSDQHVSLPDGVSHDPSQNHEARKLILWAAGKIWEDAQKPYGSGVLKFHHSYYLKIWGNWVLATGEQLGYQCIMMDEGQDADPVASAVLRIQRCQTIWVGDSAQAIYGWRGAVNSLERMIEHGLSVFPLTQSFRFGPAIAEVANLWLPHTGAEPNLKGFDPIDSRLGAVDEGRPYAVLCRTNAGVVASVLAATEQGRTVATVGNIRDVTSLMEAAGKLKDGQRVPHHQLAIFANWDHLCAHVRSEVGEDDNELRLVVNILAKHGAEAVVDALRAADQATKDAHVIVGTAHGTKGLEFDQVRIHDDWTVVPPGERIPRSYARLAYVACTRARRVLDLGGLRWILDR